MPLSEPLNERGKVCSLPRENILLKNELGGLIECKVVGIHPVVYIDAANLNITCQASYTQFLFSVNFP